VGKSIWSADDIALNSSWPEWTFRTQELLPGALDLAVAVSVTHDTSAAVEAYVKRALPEVGTLLIAEPQTGSGAKAVTSGHHAFRLAETLTRKVRSMRATGAVGRVHLFMAAPGGFAFFFGQRHVAIGPLTLYEFDFEGGKDASYEASLSLPVKATGVSHG
jgi:hypothetical protein